MITEGKATRIHHIGVNVKDVEGDDVCMGIKHNTHKDSLEGVCSFIDPNEVTLPLEFMMPVKGRVNPLK
jgi:hypothetical protein